jgi:hypothetical protein
MIGTTAGGSRVRVASISAYAAGTIGVGVVLGLPAWLCIPVWFLILGRQLRGS